MWLPTPRLRWAHHDAMATETAAQHLHLDGTQPSGECADLESGRLVPEMIRIGPRGMGRMGMISVLPRNAISGRACWHRACIARVPRRELLRQLQQHLRQERRKLGAIPPRLPVRHRAGARPALRRPRLERHRIQRPQRLEPPLPRRKHLGKNERRRPLWERAKAKVS